MIIINHIPAPKSFGRPDRRDPPSDFAFGVLLFWTIVLLLGTFGQIVASEMGYLAPLLKQMVTAPAWSPWFGGSQISLFKLWLIVLLGSPVPVFLAAYLAKCLLSR
jgi:hypothetical protein